MNLVVMTIKVFSTLLRFLELESHYWIPYIFIPRKSLLGSVPALLGTQSAYSKPHQLGDSLICQAYTKLLPQVNDAVYFLFKGSPYGVMAKVLNCSLWGKSLNSSWAIMFTLRLMPLGKGMNPLIPLSCGLNSITAVLLQGYLCH